MAKYLLELGTEELPYRFIPSAIEQLKTGFEKFFTENKIGYDKVDILATPRRLTVLVDGLQESQPDEEKVMKGPIKKVAYDESGSLSKAGQGFLAKCGVQEKDSYIQDDYLHAKVFIKGKSTVQALQENVPAIVMKLQGPYFMRWAANEEKFSRPIRWIVSILDDKAVELQIVDVKSSNLTRGHRFSPDKEISITDASEYVEKLKKAHVYVNQDERKALIVESAQKEAAKLDAKVAYDDDLLDEVTYLCEYPVPVVCDFQQKYLDIPEMVTVTVMASHQRYFALYKNEKLINKFITITNFIGDEFENIKAGNERVVTARLDDAIFFFKEDTKKPFESYVEALKGVTFQKGMGSVYDKTQRVVELSKSIAGALGVQDKDVARTALLCKADLTTNLVFEFTELQGFIGSDYARISGENDKVVEGIKEHYFPLNAESELAQGVEGQIVGIADKLDTICAVFVGGKIPTGSSDPLGVRRAALGVLKTILGKNLELDLSDLIKKTLNSLPVSNDSQAAVEDFFVQRLIIFLSDKFRKDVLEACAKVKNPLESLCDYVKRVEIVSKLVSSADFAQMHECANRISRILKEKCTKEINQKLFAHESEQNLFAAIKEIDETSYETLVTGLIAANDKIEKFFEKVLVNDENEAVKVNRQALLSQLLEKYNALADFSLIVG